MASTVTLSAVKAGITRLRTKGGASEDSLYDLANAYVTAARTIKPRPGSSRHATLPEGTVGLALFNGVFQVFSDRGIVGMPANFNLNVLSHPEPDPDNPPSLVRIWKAEPFMGGLYVVAEWSDQVGTRKAYHYWIQTVSAGDWKPETIHMLYDKVTPTLQNGIAYEAHRLLPADPVWQPNVERALNDAVEPTTFNGYRYVAIEVIGSPPKSGAVEPNWIAREGALVIEEADVPIQRPPVQNPPPTTPPGYQNPGGGGGGGSRPNERDRPPMQEY